MFYYAEMIEMWRKLFMCGLIMFIVAGSMFQSACFLAICGFFVLLQVKMRPFEDPVDNKVQLLAQIGMFVTLFCAIMISMTDCEELPGQVVPNSSLKNYFGPTMLAVNMLILVAILYISAVEIFAIMDKIGLVLSAAKAMCRFATTLVTSRMSSDDDERSDLLSEQVDELSTPQEMAAAALEIYTRLKHEVWQKEMVHELRVYYTHSTTGQLTLMQFSQLLKRWNSEMEGKEEQQLLLAMMDLNAPWYIADEQLQLWLTATLYLLDDEVSLEVLDELMPLEGVSFLAARSDIVPEPSNKPPLVRRAWITQLFNRYASKSTNTKFMRQEAFQRLALAAGCDQIKGSLLPDRSTYSLQDLYDWSDREFKGWCEDRLSHALLGAMQDKLGTTEDITQFQLNLFPVAREARQKLAVLASQRSLCINQRLDAQRAVEECGSELFGLYDYTGDGTIESKSDMRQFIYQVVTELQQKHMATLEELQGPVLDALTLAGEIEIAEDPLQWSQTQALRWLVEHILPPSSSESRQGVSKKERPLSLLERRKLELKKKL